MYRDHTFRFHTARGRIKALLHIAPTPRANHRHAAAPDMADESEDLEGRNAGCGLVIGVTSGADSEAALWEAGADVVVPNLTAIQTDWMASYDDSYDLASESQQILPVYRRSSFSG